MCKWLVNSKAFHTVQGKVLYEAPLLSVFQHPSLCVLGLGPESLALPFPSIIHLWKCLRIFCSQDPQTATQIYCQLNSVDIQSSLPPHPKLWPHKVFFYSPYFPRKQKRMVREYLPAWFVNRFADKMLIFQTSRLNSFQTKTKLCCKANMRNKLFHGNTTRFIFMSHLSALSTHRTVLFTYHP